MSRASSAAPLTFGRYEALFHIASGGMAEVFAARLRGPAGFEKLVAVKRLLPDLSDEHFVQMFLDEARLAAHISSPNVVQTLELGRAEEDGALYIVMELVIGVTLFDLCVQCLKGGGPMPIDMAIEIITQAARGLDDAHNARTPTGQALQVIHRDISPQNILVGADGRVRVTDFGIARAVSRSVRTRAGQLKGKMAYLSPEQAEGGKLDRSSDVFALGIVTWELLTGRSLFNTGDGPSTLTRVRELPIPSPRALRRELPEELAEVVLWALERDPRRRCQDASRYARALREAYPVQLAPYALGDFVDQNGGPSIARIRQHMGAVQKGAEVSFVRPASATIGRIVPQAPVPELRVLGPPAAPLAPPTHPPIGQREVGTDIVNVPAERTSPPAKHTGKHTAPHVLDPGRTRVRRMLILVGALAWVAAALLLWVLLRPHGPQGGPALSPAGAPRAE